jgi:hypothetical protein
MNRSRTPASSAFAIGGILLAVAAGLVHLVPIGVALVVVIAIVWFMSDKRTRENRARHEAEVVEWEAQNPNPQGGWQPPTSSEGSPRNAWSSAATMLAVAAAVGGLAILSMVVLLFAVLSSGNFKMGNK